MAARTVASHVRPQILQNPSSIYTSWVWGLVADAYHPGDVVYESSVGNWTLQATNAGHLSRSAVVGDVPRTDSTFARKDVDDAFVQYDQAPMITSGIVVAKTVDPAASYVRGTLLGLSTVGTFAIVAAYTDFPRAVLLEAYTDNDLYCLVGLGMCMWLNA